MERAERLAKLAVEGGVSKAVLATMLATDARSTFLTACAATEKRFTEECTASGDPCLESGCALESETCLQPLLRAGDAYYKACADQWVKLFADPRNRRDTHPRVL